MINLDVYFVRDSEIGTACVIHNLITDRYQLELSPKLKLGEVKFLIDKAVNNLKNIYDIVNVTKHWDTIEEEK